MRKVRANQLVGFFIFLTSLIFGGNALYAKSTEDKIRKSIDEFAKDVHTAVDKIEENDVALQEYFDHYQWKGILEGKVKWGVATLEQLELKGHPRAVIARPGERIQARVRYSFDREKCSSLTFYRVVVGLNNYVGPQTTIANSLGLTASEGKDENFVLIAPSQPGLYEVRFRPTEKLLESEAFKEWFDENGKEPDSRSTIGFIYVKP